MRTPFFGLVAAFGCLVGVALTQACAAGGEATDDGGCAVGSETCPCTTGGACDPGLQCLSNICVNPNPTGGGNGGTGGSTTVSTGSGAGMPCLEGCAAIDVVFALDSSQSMELKHQSLAAQGAFTQIVQTLATLNCGTIDYRIGVTNDNDRGWTVPSAWSGSVPWFDSKTMGDNEIVLAFGGATQRVIADGKVLATTTPTGCEHVLTSAVSLLASDTTGFLRPEALLVLVLVTDVDDYGAYDQASGNVCGFGCTTPPTPVQSLYDSLVTLKGGDAAAVASVVISGDPSGNGGNNLCGQPLSCSGDVYHADRLWQFVGLHTGMNGYVDDLCKGPSIVPTSVQAAFDSNIDLACQQFEPPK